VFGQQEADDVCLEASVNQLELGTSNKSHPMVGQQLLDTDSAGPRYLKSSPYQPEEPVVAQLPAVPGR
jgi:hypothetical protein